MTVPTFEPASPRAAGDRAHDAAEAYRLPADVAAAIARWLVDVDLALDDTTDDQDRVRAVAALLRPLLQALPAWLELDALPVHAEGYQRVCLGRSARSGVSIYAMSWLAGQVTEIHDHGTWGAVGVVRGGLREVRYERPATGPMRAGPAASYVPGAVATFVEEPQLIHTVEALATAARTTSLHVYGAEISGFHVYEAATGAATWVDVETHNDPR